MLKTSFVLVLCVCYGYSGLQALGHDQQRATSILPKNVNQVWQKTKNVIIDCRHELQKICYIPLKKRTFQNTIEACDRAWQKFTQVYRVSKLLSTTSSSRNIRRACREAFVFLAQREKDLFESREVLDALNEYITKAVSQEKLTKEQQALLGLFKERGRRVGLNCPAEQWAHIVDLRKHLASDCLLFRTNVWNAKKVISCSLDISRVSDECLACLSHIKGFQIKRGQMVIPLTPQARTIVLGQCSDQTVRRAFYVAFQNLAWPDNMLVLNRILRRRSELARLLGYKSYSDFDAEPTMARTDEKARSFVATFCQHLRPSLRAEFDELKKEWLAIGGCDDERFDPWNYLYASVLHKKQDPLFNNRTTFSLYFPFEPTVKKIVDFAADRLGLQCEWQKTEKGWHPNVLLVKISKQGTGQTVGFLFLDLIRRDHKVGDSRHMALKFADRQHAAVSAIIANFKQPTGNAPVCMSHKNIKTLFHELGHALHTFLSKTSLYFYSSYFKGRDFSEGMAQLFERFSFNRSLLQKMSSHYKTGAQISNNILTAALQASEHSYAIRLQSMCMHSMQALFYHDEQRKKDTDKINKTIYDKYIYGLNFVEGVHSQTRFLHITSYAAQYYCYLWARGVGGALYSYLENDSKLCKARWKHFVSSVLSNYWRSDQRIALTKFLGKQLSDKDLLHYGLKVEM